MLVIFNCSYCVEFALRIRILIELWILICGCMFVLMIRSENVGF